MLAMPTGRYVLPQSGSVPKSSPAAATQYISFTTAGGGGGSVGEYLNDPLTSNANVTEWGFAGSGSWVYSANGAEWDSGGSSRGGIIWDDPSNASPADSAGFTLEWHSVVSSGANYTGRLFVLVDGVTAQKFWNGFYVETANTTAKLYKRENGVDTELDSVAVSAISGGDTMKITVTPNGSNYDVKGYKNDVEILSATNVSHSGSLGTKTAYEAESASAGWDAVVKNALGEGP